MTGCPAVADFRLVQKLVASLGDDAGSSARAASPSPTAPMVPEEP